MKLAILTLALASAGVSSTVFAAQLQGKVTDNQGNAIANAIVAVDGANQTTTDANGHYQLNVTDNSHLHLHVSNNKYKHAERDIQSGKDSLTENFTLVGSKIENIVVTASPLGRSAAQR